MNRVGRRCSALVVCLSFCAVTFAAARADRLPSTIPGTLRLAIATQPNSLNPLLQQEVVESLIESMLFDQPFVTHPDGDIDPQLATVVPTQRNGGISADGRTITVHFRRGVRWHDGKPFTSADVAYTNAAHVNPANNATRSPFDEIVRTETPDAQTVVMHLRAPDAGFLAVWGVYPVVPAHLLAALPNANHASIGSTPVGTGPFVFDHWDRAREIVLRANDAYYLGAPKLRRIVIKLLADDNSEVIALRAHEIDMIFQPSETMRPLVAGDPTLRFLTFNVNGVYDIQFNTTRPPLDDPRVRDAISIAIDRGEIAAKAMHGLGTPATGNIPSFSWAADPTLTAPYDPARSRALLQAAGWTPGADGILVKDGHRLAIDAIYPAGLGAAEAVTLLVQPMLRAVGIDLTLKPVQTNVMFAPAVAGGLLATGNFDLSFDGFFSNDDPGADAIRFLCSQRAPVGFNAARWCDPEYDRLAAAARATYDRTKRRVLYAKIERLLLDQAPMAFLIWPKETTVVSADVQNVEDPVHHDLALPWAWSI